MHDIDRLLPLLAEAGLDPEVLHDGPGHRCGRCERHPAVVREMPALPAAA